MNYFCLRTYLLVLIIFTKISYSNDTYLGSVGGNLFSKNYDVYGIFLSKSRSTSVQLIKEKIHIIILRDSFIAYCKFWFYNISDSLQRVYVGFPNNYQDFVATTSPLRNFKVWVNGKEIKTEKWKERIYWEGDSLKPYFSKIWFAWKNDFPAKETTLIENRYTGSLGQLPDGIGFISYVLGTGATWKLPILEGKIIFDHSNVFSSYFVIKDRWGNTNLKPCFYSDSVVFSFQNYIPTENEVVQIYFIMYWFIPITPDGIIKYLEKARLSKKEIQLMRYEILAYHGYPFKNEKLRKYFASKKWYKENPLFNKHLLNEYENTTIRILLEFEKKLK